ncbi:histone acetyltransferase type B catalytic subunit isoform X1 [Dermacentor albipictus]|uniref:histone acetyltransferase type B catalytic subunit isoform X1 n=2 Tax=Dermacentor albipictus TaxID=60249 RepID=UPI0038FBFD58
MYRQTRNCVSLSKEALEAYVVSANDVVHFKLVMTTDDIEDDDIAFNPEMSHQIFGEGESIFGYRDLQVKLYYGSCSLTPYLGMSYTEKIDLKKSDGLKADDVLKTVLEKLPSGVHTNIDEFVSILPKETTFRPFGELLHSFKIGKGGLSRTFELYSAGVTTPGFLDYHARMQSFILWFIDAASYIDSDDEKWEYFVLHEKRVVDGVTCYPFVGYATVYRYYAYPTHIRPRISQMLVLPPYQKMGLGTELLQGVYNFYRDRSDVLDITGMEDPSEVFTRLRDFVDARNCLKLASFAKEHLLKGFSEEMWKEAQQKLKVNKKQARRVYEILRLRATNTANASQYKAYRLEVKNRLNAPYQKQKTDVEKLQRTMSPEEFRATLQCLNAENRIEQLESQYRDLEMEYRRTIERLAVAPRS